MQVIFYDARQSIRTPDISKKRFDEICSKRLYKYVELYSQMRCNGGNGYYDYVKKVLENTSLDVLHYKPIANYEIKFFDCFEEMRGFIDYQNTKGDGLCKIVAGPAWNINEDIIIEDIVYHWVGSESKNNSIIYSIHKTQGFDLNYAGVVFGREIYYDINEERIEVNKKNLKDNFLKSSGDNQMRQYLIDIYLTLMTRGIKGTCIYVMDDSLRMYLKKYLLQ